MVGMMTPKAIIVRQGDSYLIRIHLQSRDKIIDLNQTTSRMQVRDNQGKMLWELKGKMILPKGVNEDNCIAFHITPEQSNIEVGDYRCDIQLETIDGSVNTIFPANINQVGIFRVTEQITK